MGYYESFFPEQGCANPKPRYFLTAYEIAVKHGFKGTEEEWLISLTAFKMAQVAGYAGTVDDWLADLIDPVPNLQIGEVVTLAGGSDATASITGDKRNPILNLGIPQGVGMEDALPMTGGKMKGELDMNGYAVQNLPEPEKDGDAVSKGHLSNREAEILQYALDMTNETEDDANAYTKAQVKKARPYNHLDNSYFANPVASEGFKANPGSNGNPIDRWYDRYGFGEFTLTEDGITVAYGTNHAYFNQAINNASKLIGKTLTLAACKYDGTIIICSGVFTGSGMSLAATIEGANVITVDNDYVQVCIVEGSVGFRWIALYEGAYTLETLPEYQPKGYKVEELNCGANVFERYVTIPASSWYNIYGSVYQYDLYIDGLLSTDIVDVDVYMADRNGEAMESNMMYEEEFAKIYHIPYENGVMWVRAREKPEVDLPIKIKVVR